MKFITSKIESYIASKTPQYSGYRTKIKWPIFIIRALLLLIITIPFYISEILYNFFKFLVETILFVSPFNYVKIEDVNQ